MQGFEASLPPPKHKRSTDEVFSEPQRLHKVLASCGFGSRRAMEELILAGRITVNRMPADIGQKVGPGDEVRINGEPVKIRFAEPKARVLVYHKPTGELVTRDDPEERPTVFGMLPAIKDGRWIAVRFDLALALLCAGRRSRAFLEYSRGVHQAVNGGVERLRGCLRVALDDLEESLSERPALATTREAIAARELLRSTLADHPPSRLSG